MRVWLSKFLGVSLLDARISVLSEQIAGLKERERRLEMEISYLKKSIELKELKEKVEQKNIRIGA